MQNSEWRHFAICVRVLLKNEKGNRTELISEKITKNVRNPNLVEKLTQTLAAVPSQMPPSLRP